MATRLLQHTMSKAFVKRLSVYLLGVFISGFGVNIVIRSNFGAGAWDAVNDNFRALTGVTLGTASFITNLIVLFIILIYRRNIKFLMTLLPIFGTAVAIDLWDIVLFGSWEPTILLTRILAFIVGMFVLPLGLTLIIITKFPAMVYDELTFILMEILKVKSFMYVRWGVEIFAMSLATFYGFLANISFGSVNIGTVLISVSIGPIIQWYLKKLKYQS